MLRVSCLGLSLPQSTLTASCSPYVSAWSPLRKAHKKISTRFAWNKAIEFIELQDSQQTPKKKNRDGKGVIYVPPSVGLFRQEILRNVTRPPRSPRRIPRYASVQEPQDPMRVSPCAEEVKQNALLHTLDSTHEEKQDNAATSKLSADDLPTAATPPRIQEHHGQRQERYALLRILSKTSSAYEAWDAYAKLINYSPRPFVANPNPSDRNNLQSRSVIPYKYLHRLAMLLSRTKPRTRKLFLHLNSVLTMLRESGGIVYVWEWNALIDCAGKGWRKTTIDDYFSALSIFKDMVVSGQNATSSQGKSIGIGNVSPKVSRPVAQPDIVTFTTLLNIASRTLSQKAINHAMSLLDASDLRWNRLTHLARLRYFTRTRQLDSVREILREAAHQGLDLATMNGCLWAYARCGRLQVALEVYERMRRNINAADRTDFGDADVASGHSPEQQTGENPILSIPGFTLPPAMCPDVATYTLLIQAMCYHGDFISAMKIFRDMMSTVDPRRRNAHSHPVGRRPQEQNYYYKPSLGIYRAIFLAFTRHAHKRRTHSSLFASKRQDFDVTPLQEFATNLTHSGPDSNNSRKLPPKDLEEEPYWNTKNLEIIFKSFLEMGWDENGTEERPSDRMIYWILVAYAKTTKGDVGKMYKVWRELNALYGLGDGTARVWTGRIARIGQRLERAAIK